MRCVYHAVDVFHQHGMRSCWHDSNSGQAPVATAREGHWLHQPTGAPGIQSESERPATPSPPACPAAASTVATPAAATLMQALNQSCPLQRSHLLKRYRSALEAVFALKKKKNNTV